MCEQHNTGEGALGTGGDASTRILWDAIHQICTWFMLLYCRSETGVDLVTQIQQGTVCPTYIRKMFCWKKYSTKGGYLNLYRGAAIN